jgi:hypothetical protein
MELIKIEEQKLVNAREELEKILREVESKVICAYIFISKNEQESCLRMGYTDVEYKQFLESLDFDFDIESEGKALNGVIWLENGLWLDRFKEEYSEWWEISSNCPEMLRKLLREGAGNNDNS